MFLSVGSGVHLLAMGFYDIWGWYYQQERETLWTMPWGIPPRATLLRFGAVAPKNDSYYYGIHSPTGDPYFAYYLYRYMGVVTSLVVCTSVAEWVLVAGAWRLLHISSRIRKKHHPPPTNWHEFGAMFVASAGVGQLWMFAFDATDYLVTGSVALGPYVFLRIHS